VGSREFSTNFSNSLREFSVKFKLPTVLHCCSTYLSISDTMLLKMFRKQFILFNILFGKLHSSSVWQLKSKKHIITGNVMLSMSKISWHLLMMFVMYDVSGYRDWNDDLLAVSHLSLTVCLQQHVCSVVHDLLIITTNVNYSTISL